MKSVVICGSSRFKKEIREFARELKDMGVLVFEPHLHSGDEEWERLSDDFKNFAAMGLTYDHFRKIKIADVVFVYNKDGYIGNSTTLEMGCAVGMGKPIYALCEDKGEICRQILFQDIASSPDKLIKVLK